MQGSTTRCLHPVPRRPHARSVSLSPPREACRAIRKYKCLRAAQTADSQAHATHIRLDIGHMSQESGGAGKTVRAAVATSMGALQSCLGCVRLGQDAAGRPEVLAACAVLLVFVRPLQQAVSGVTHDASVSGLAAVNLIQWDGDISWHSRQDETSV